MWKSSLYPLALPKFFGGASPSDAYQIDWINDVLYVAILTDDYSPSDSHEFYSDVSGDELVVTGYTANGIALSGRTVTYSSTHKSIALNADNAFVSADVDNGDARYAVIWADIGSGPLVGLIDFGSIIDDINTNSGSQYGFIWNNFSNSVFTLSSWTPGAMSWYGKALANVFGGETSGEDKRTDYLSDDIKVALLDDSYAPDLDADEVYGDLTGEVSGTGYSSGGATLSGKSLSVSGNELVIDATDPVWTTTTLTDVRYAAFYNDTNADKPLLWLADTQVNQSPTAENFTLQLPGNGIARLRGW